MFNIEALIWISFWRAVKIQLFSWRVSSNPRHQSKNIEMNYMSHIKLVHEFYMIHLFSILWRIKNINDLTPLLVVTMPYACGFLWWTNYIEDFKWRLHFRFGVAFWKVVLREVYFEGPNRVWRALKTSILNIGSPFQTAPPMLNSRSWMLISVSNRFWKMIFRINSFKWRDIVLLIFHIELSRCTY